MFWVVKTWFVRLWTDISERWNRPQGFWHDPGPCGRCGSRVFYVLSDSHNEHDPARLIMQCAMCKEREAA